MTLNKLIAFRRVDDIIIAQIDSELRIDIKLAKELVSLRLEYFNGEKFKFIVVIDKLQQVEKSARDYMASDEAREGIIVSALVSNSILGNIIINFFLRLNSNTERKIPSKFFKTEELAIQWIKKI